MSIFSAERFVRRYGRGVLARFRDRCNQGASLASLAMEFHMSIPTASRLRTTLLERQWVFKEEVRKYLEFQITYHQGEIDEHTELLERDSLLRFIPGKQGGAKNDR